MPVGRFGAETGVFPFRTELAGRFLSRLGGMRQRCGEVGHGASMRRMMRLRLRVFAMSGCPIFYGRVRVGRRPKTKADDSFFGPDPSTGR